VKYNMFIIIFINNLRRTSAQFIIFIQGTRDPSDYPCYALLLFYQITSDRENKPSI